MKANEIWEMVWQITAALVLVALYFGLTLWFQLSVPAHRVLAMVMRP